MHRSGTMPTSADHIHFRQGPAGPTRGHVVAQDKAEVRIEIGRGGARDGPGRVGVAQQEIERRSGHLRANRRPGRREGRHGRLRSAKRVAVAEEQHEEPALCWRTARGGSWQPQARLQLPRCQACRCIKGESGASEPTEQRLGAACGRNDEQHITRL
eukprot:scaffold1756_cov117-Isochrysis_galbana.AAC.17